MRSQKWLTGECYLVIKFCNQGLLPFISPFTHYGSCRMVSLTYSDTLPVISNHIKVVIDPIQSTLAWFAILDVLLIDRILLLYTSVGAKHHRASLSKLWHVTWVGNNT